MNNWFELGEKIGRIVFMVKLQKNVFLISPHDIENLYYEIIQYMKEMKLDTKMILVSKIEEYEKIIIKQVMNPNKEEKVQIFLLGIYTEELKILLTNEVNIIDGITTKELLDYIIDIMDSLKLDKSLKNISLESYNEHDFERIVQTVKNKVYFEELDNGTDGSKHNKSKIIIGIIVPIIVSLIGALATIIASMIK